MRAATVARMTKGTVKNQPNRNSAEVRETLKLATDAAMAGDQAGWAELVTLARRLAGKE